MKRFLNPLHLGAFLIVIHTLVVGYALASPPKPSPPHVRIFSRPMPFRAVLPVLKTQGRIMTSTGKLRLILDVENTPEMRAVAKNAGREIGGVIE